MLTVRAGSLHQEVTTRGWSTGKSRLGNTYLFVVPQDAPRAIWLVHMCRKQTAQTSRGTLLHYAHHATTEQTSLMPIGHWYLSQATSKKEAGSSSRKNRAAEVVRSGDRIVINKDKFDYAENYYD